MSVLTIIWSMIAGACLTLALVRLPLWAHGNERPIHLAFALAAGCTAVVVLCELAMLHARTPAAYGLTLRWVHLPVTLLLIALVAFVHLYLEAGRLWLAACGLGMRLLSTLPNFLSGETLNFREITALRQVHFLGQAVAVPVGVANPWMLLSQLGVMLLIVFVADATLSAWRRGARPVVLCAGASIVLFLGAGLAQTVRVIWAGAESPLVVSIFSLGIVGVMAYAMSRDLVRAKELTSSLGEREQEAALTADAANLGIWSLDIARNTVWASPKWRELFGFTADEALDLDRVLQRVHPDDREALRNIRPRSPDAPPSYHTEYRVLLPDGRTRWIAHQGRIEFDAWHRPVRTRGASIDITARKEGEQEMLRLRQDIAHVGRVSVMGQLASALAHEINQPLGAILRNAEAAALFIQDPSPDLAEISAIVEDIRKDDQRAGAVIDRMRALLRRQDVEVLPLDVAQVLGDVATLLRPDAAARHVKFEVEIPGDLPSVLGDRVQLQQVLLNLILNGMDALDGLDGEQRRVSVSARQDAAAGAVEISVCDSGRGIAEAEFERIFDPFFSTKSKGIGVGLSISRSIVEAHGGRLWAENSVGGGACFHFTLPTAAKAD